MTVRNRRVWDYCKDIVIYAVDGDDDGVRETLEKVSGEGLFDAVFAAIDEAHRRVTEWRDSKVTP